MKGHLKRGPNPGTWYIRVELENAPNGMRRQRRMTIKGTKSVAEDRLQDLLREVRNGAYADGGRMLIKDVAEAWLATTEHRVGVKTYQSYAAHVRIYITPSLGHRRAEALRPAHVEAALVKWTTGSRNDRQDGQLSQRSIAHIFNTLKTICRWAIKMGILIRNPADAVNTPRVDRKEMHALKPSGFVALRQAAQGTELEHIISVAIGTGLRCGELLGLQWLDIDFENRRLAVRRSVETLKGIIRTKPPKTTRSLRTISMPGFVADALRCCRAEQNELRMLLGLGRGHDDGWVFTHHDQTQWEPSAFSLAFARMIKKHKLPHVRFHDLRHSFATLAITSGVDLKTISSALGHSTISVTANTYLHQVDSLQRDAADRIDALLGPTITRAMKSVDGTNVPHGTLEQQKTA